MPEIKSSNAFNIYHGKKKEDFHIYDLQFLELSGELDLNICSLTTISIFRKEILSTVNNLLAN
jgi:hypothetical protein